MKKLFQLPVVESVEIAPSENIMADAILLSDNAKNLKVNYVSDTVGTNPEYWKNTDAWL